ncbi:esterase-like activity of phytase-domain-containing protein [Sparassis latifolia]
MSRLYAASLHAYSSPLAVLPRRDTTEPDPSLYYYAELAGKTYINKGLVAYRFIPSNATDIVGDTIGGIGSAIGLKPYTWTASSGTFSGTLIVQPDRGYNVQGPVNYQGRVHEYAFLTYLGTTLHYDRGGVNTTGLDALAVRAATARYPQLADADPQMPVATVQDPRLCLDAEGLIADTDGSVWTSDEYGPYIYHFSAAGDLIQTIQPPEAFLPYSSDGMLNFTSETEPAAGRVGNQGFEGLSLDISTRRLYVLLQSPTVQDGGLLSNPSPYTRLLAFDVSDPNEHPPVVGEWVVPLPLSNSGSNLYAASEVHFVAPGVFLVLSRDGKGEGGSSDKSKYKQADLFDISNATDVNTPFFNAPGGAVSPGGTLNSTITPATYVSFVDYLNATQLARFGLHNGKPDDDTLIDRKWESLALAPVGDPAYPDDYFLFTAADNDFQTEDGVSVGVSYDAGLNENTQFMVFRLTLPGAAPQLDC